MGWYKESTFNSLWNFSSDTVTEDTTLYAKWSKYYKITYRLNSGTQNASNPSKYTVESATITLLSPTRKGYAFGGWYKDSGLKTKVTKIKKRKYRESDASCKMDEGQRCTGNHQ